MDRPPLFIVMGVSGCGKSTIGKLLAAEFEFSFFDGDDYHPKENVDKMSDGIPLTDEDREDWLKKLNTLAKEYCQKGLVIACSALKQSYRDCLSKELENQMKFVFLNGTKIEIAQRLQERKGHFMPPGLLDSQFSALEAPTGAITISIQHTPKKIILQILEKYRIKKP